MEVVLTSDTSVNFNVTTRRYIPEDSELHIRRRENLKSHILCDLSLPMSLHDIAYMYRTYFFCTLFSFNLMWPLNCSLKLKLSWVDVKLQTAFLDFVRSCTIPKKDTAFLKLDLFPSLGRKLVGCGEKCPEDQTGTWRFVIWFSGRNRISSLELH
jgi:hypothetical protein